MTEGNNSREVKTVQDNSGQFYKSFVGLENCTVYDFAQYSDITYYDDYVIDYYNFYQQSNPTEEILIDQ